MRVKSFEQFNESKKDGNTFQPKNLEGRKEKADELAQQRKQELTKFVADLKAELPKMPAYKVVHNIDEAKDLSIRSGFPYYTVYKGATCRVYKVTSKSVYAYVRYQGDSDEADILFSLEDFYDATEKL
jgi:hypothetical protein